MDSTVDIAVGGAGAAGLAAAIFAAEPSYGSYRLAIHVLDGAKTIGAKILISGGGRCNVTHEVVTPTDFFGNRRIIKNVLAAFSVEQTIKWFSSLGVELKREETGKLFPVTDKARTVLNALTRRCRELNVLVRSDHRVTGIDHLADREAGFVVRHRQGELRAKHVILATGGRSLPRTGSDGWGWDLVRRLGHSVTEVVPALVPLVLSDHMFHRALSGLSQEVELTTMVEGRTADRRTGSLLWTHFGVSGPVVLDASRFWTIARRRNERVELYANFLPAFQAEEAWAWLSEQASRHPRRSLAKTLAQLVPERFAVMMCERVSCEPQTQVAQLPRQPRSQLLGALTRLRLPVVSDRGWNYAEVTAGGVPLEEVNFRTMESKLVTGLYLIGEILDCDGRIGGFNFQWAWASGFLAGRAAALRVRAGDATQR